MLAGAFFPILTPKKDHPCTVGAGRGTRGWFLREKQGLFRFYVDMRREMRHSEGHCR